MHRGNTMVRRELKRSLNWSPLDLCSTTMSVLLSANTVAPPQCPSGRTSQHVPWLTQSASVTRGYALLTSQPSKETLCKHWSLVGKLGDGWESQWTCPFLPMNIFYLPMLLRKHTSAMTCCSAILWSFQLPTSSYLPVVHTA